MVIFIDDKQFTIVILVILLCSCIIGGAVYLGLSNMHQEPIKNNDSSLNNTSKVNNTTDVPQTDSGSGSNSHSSQKSASSSSVDYNSPDSDYYRSEADGNYYKKEPGVNYIYDQDYVTGEWSYWADKS